MQAPELMALAPVVDLSFHCLGPSFSCLWSFDLPHVLASVSLSFAVSMLDIGLLVVRGFATFVPLVFAEHVSGT